MSERESTVRDATRRDLDGTPATVRQGRLLAGLLAVVGAGGLLGVRLVANAPGAAPRWVDAVRPAAEAGALLAPAAAALALCWLAESPFERVGFATAGAFGLLVAVDAGAATPAAGAVVVAAVLVAADGVDATRRRRTLERGLVTAGMVAGLASSVAATAGLAPATLRPLGSQVAVLALAGLPAFVRPVRRDWLAGAAAVAVVLAAVARAPFVVGAVSLVGAAAVDVGPVVLAAGVGGTAVATAGAVRTGRATGAVGVVLAAVAGVPATIPRAVAVVVAIGLLLDTRMTHERNSIETDDGRHR